MFKVNILCLIGIRFQAVSMLIHNLFVQKEDGAKFSLGMSFAADKLCAFILPPVAHKSEYLLLRLRRKKQTLIHWVNSAKSSGNRALAPNVKFEKPWL